MKPLKFAALAMSGGLLPSHTSSPRLPLPYVIDLADMTAAKELELNFAHRSGDVVGQITAVEITPTSVFVKGVVDRDTESANLIRAGVAVGLPWEVSIEGTLKVRELIEASEKVTLNGQQMQGPFFAFYEPKLTGLALCARGADVGNVLVWEDA